MNLAKLIKEAVESYNQKVGEEWVGFRPDYSGRGMFGRDCVGITGSWSNCQKVIALVIKTDFEAALVAEDDDFEALVYSMLNFKFDSMGYDVILYWEDIQWEDEEEEFYDVLHQRVSVLTPPLASGRYIAHCGVSHEDFPAYYNKELDCWEDHYGVEIAFGGNGRKHIDFWSDFS